MPDSSFKIHKHKIQRVVSKQTFSNNLDKICLVFSVLMPATTIPQIIQIYTTKNVTGLSLWTWILYSIGVIPFLFYGFVHKEKPLIILNTLWLLVQSVIIFGILAYR